MNYKEILEKAHAKFRWGCEARDLIHSFIDQPERLEFLDADRLFRVLMLDESWPVLDAGQVYHSAMQALVDQDMWDHELRMAQGS